MTQRVRKGFCYITRGSQLLVFAHHDDPDSGIQVPAGSVRPDESPAQGAAREAWEETGLDGLHLQSYLGTTDWLAAPEVVHERHFFHFLAPEGAPEAWVWQEDHDGLAPPEVFELSWAALPAAGVLIAEMGALLDRLPVRR